MFSNCWCWCHNCCDRSNPSARQSKSMRITFKSLFAVCSRRHRHTEEQLKSGRLSSGFDTKQTAASQTLSLRLSDLFAQTLQKGKNSWWRGWWLRWWWRALRQCFLSRCYSLLFFSTAIPAPPFPRMTRRQSNYKRINKETAYIDPWAS